jgi:16S rRNA (guanine527-N7)-methyltransferase
VTVASKPPQVEAAELEALGAGLGLELSATQVTRLQRYLDLLERWNGAYNLTAVRERAGMITQHLADCLAMVPALRRHVAGGRLLDVGSGGGLPGVVIAALLPAMDVTCVDAVGKKAAFVRQVAGTLPLANLHAVHGRIEELHAPPCGVVTSRAFATLAVFTALTRRHLAPGGVWLAMKGRVPDDEITALPEEVEVFHVEQIAVPGLDAQRCLVWMRDKHPA